MSELTDYEWAQKALNALYLELPAEVASDCIPKLKRIIELYESKLARLREKIEKAPHGKLCSSHVGFMIFGHKCDCWKRDALKEGK